MVVNRGSAGTVQGLRNVTSKIVNGWGLWRDAVFFFRFIYRSRRNSQKKCGSQPADFFFFLFVFFEIATKFVKKLQLQADDLFFLFLFGERHKSRKKVTFLAAFSQRLQDFCTFSDTNEEGEKLEGTLDVIILCQIVMGFLEPLNVSLGFKSTKKVENHRSKDYFHNHLIMTNSNDNFQPTSD